MVPWEACLANREGLRVLFAGLQNDAPYEGRDRHVLQRADPFAPYE